MEQRKRKEASALKKLFVIRFIFYIGGFLLITLGIALSKRSGLGVSPVSSIPYAVSGIAKLGISLSTVIVHCFFVVFQILLLRKDFKIKNILQVPVGILFGLFTGMFQAFANHFLPDPTALNGFWNPLTAGIMCYISTFLIAFGIFFYVPADFVPLAGEGVMLAISQKSGIKFSTVKIGFDVTMVVSSFIACVIYAGGLRGGINMRVIGIGTIVAAVIVGVNLKLVIRVFGKWRDRVLQISGTANN